MDGWMNFTKLVDKRVFINCSPALVINQCRKPIINTIPSDLSHDMLQYNNLQLKLGDIIQN